MEHSGFSPELNKAINEGFILEFTFADGFICCDFDACKAYATKDVAKEVRPCIASETNLYRFQTPDGLKGYAIVSWKEGQDD